MQKFKAVLFRRVPRPDSPDLAGNITNKLVLERRRREKPPKAGKIAEGGKLCKMGFLKMLSKFTQH